MDRNLFKDFAM